MYIYVYTHMCFNCPVYVNNITLRRTEDAYTFFCFIWKVFSCIWKVWYTLVFNKTLRHKRRTECGFFYNTTMTTSKTNISDSCGRIINTRCYKHIKKMGFSFGSSQNGRNVECGHGWQQVICVHPITNNENFCQSFWCIFFLVRKT